MIIINTTFVMETSLTEDVLDWIRNTYIASAVHCNALTEKTLLTRVLDHHNEDVQSHALHLWFGSMTDATHWDNRLGAKLRSKLTERWGERVLAFHTYMEVTE